MSLPPESPAELVARPIARGDAMTVRDQRELESAQADVARLSEDIARGIATREWLRNGPLAQFRRKREGQT